MFENFCEKSLTSGRGEILTIVDNSISPGFFLSFFTYSLFDALAVLQFPPSLLINPVAENRKRDHVSQVKDFNKIGLKVRINKNTRLCIKHYGEHINISDS